MNARTLLRAVRDHVFQASGYNALARRRLDGSRAAILMYHRVLPEPEARRLAVEPAMYVTPESFDLQLATLRARGFEPLPLHTLCTSLANGAPWPRRAVAITFDDGWLDNHIHALPILQRQGVPATVFVVTERVGTSGAFWTDEVARRLVGLDPDVARAIAGDLLQTPLDQTPPRDALLEAMKTRTHTSRAKLLERLRAATEAHAPAERELMTWDELDTWSRSGGDVESHGCSHELFDGLDDGALERELRASLEQLRGHGHGRHGLLAYPSGAYDTRVVAAARAAGYLGAVTTQHRLATRADHAHTLPRLGIHEAVGRPRARFLSKVPGWK